MPKIEKAKRREARKRKSRYGMRINGKSLEAIINSLRKRAENVRD